MSTPFENMRLLDPKPIAASPSPSPDPRYLNPGEAERGWRPPLSPPRNRPVDVNAMKRNMSIAKGFMDISLLTANANQLKHVIIYGDQSTYVYHVLITCLSLSLILQIATGVLLIVKERFDLNVEEDQSSADLYNNITVLLVFLTLLLNVFISSFGISVIKHPQKGIYPVKQGVNGIVGKAVATTHNPLVEIFKTTSNQPIFG